MGGLAAGCPSVPTGRTGSFLAWPVGLPEEIRTARAPPQPSRSPPAGSCPRLAPASP
ncbi:MAG: hypothetical protein AVDCRST_MAG76-2675 [uncultured Acidimicrobiales bacterium]|uniref:Uncharacterized protein n=1 Tax=uncultured Acidimicrobiales bacterium TaxID=310071 RepID=A0A6J4ISQ1_9ACTN|nr:MAG: hypothetical protein AVDCRST_MAG76-2675 [uncultured Acidimicrobiales bacterium]